MSALAAEGAYPGAPTNATDPEGAERAAAGYAFGSQYGAPAMAATDLVQSTLYGDPRGRALAMEGAGMGAYGPDFANPEPYQQPSIFRGPETYLPPTGDFSMTGGDPSLPTFGTENLPVLPVDPRFATTDPNNPLNQVAGPATTGTQSNPTLDRTRQQAGMGSNAAGQQIDPVASRDAAYQSAVDDVLGVSGADPNIPFRSAGERQGGGRPVGATPAPAASAPAPAPMQGGGTGRTANLANAGAPVAMQSASQQYTPGSLGAILAARGTRGRIFT